MNPKLSKLLIYSTCFLALTACDDDDKPKPPGDGDPPQTNQTPIASVNYQCQQLTCSFSGADSKDPDGQIVKYVWQFGDGQGSTEISPQHTYTEAGTYKVSLMVADDKQAADKKTIEVTVKSDGPGDDGDTPDDDPTNANNECNNWEAKHKDWIWCDDFEGGLSLAEKYGKNSVQQGEHSDSLTTTDNDAANGKHALVLKWGKDQKNAGSFRRNFGLVPFNSSADDLGKTPYQSDKFEEIYYRFYIKYPEKQQGSPKKLVRAVGVADGKSQFGPQSFIAGLIHSPSDEKLALDTWTGFDPANPDSTLKTVKWDDIDNLTALSDTSGDDDIPPPPPPGQKNVADPDDDGDIPPPPPPPGDGDDTSDDGDIPPPPPPGDGDDDGDKPDDPDTPIPPPPGDGDKPGDGQNPLTKGQWHCVEVKVKLNSTEPYASNGTMQVMIDGKPQDELTAGDLNWTGKWRNYGINAIQFESVWENNSDQERQSYIDSFVISKAPIGCHKGDGDDDGDNPDDPNIPPPPPPGDGDDDGDNPDDPNIPPPPPPGDGDDDGDNPDDPNIPPPPPPGDGDDDGDNPDDPNIPPPPPPGDGDDGDDSGDDDLPPPPPPPGTPDDDGDKPNDPDIPPPLPPSGPDKGDEKPTAPTGLSISVSSVNGQKAVTLQWQDTSNNELMFVIQKREKGKDWQYLNTVETNTTQFIDKIVEAGKTYKYRVKATNKTGDSNFSNVVSGSAT
ncbi:PKD domain-containing protein [Zooshikella marina]|uniref:PKD domain-containing protein n=1 Tax=Zooshikella ganghwensis TaxID=202772 RepID=UPI001BB028C4|nr:PKD domain-containing protein [Zooshikella ganghwensis]MBU2708181.1 PKD domain-containing protein [Zooshikella ganghwensis]